MMAVPANDVLPFDGVAFDLDGTLVDSAADIGHALNSALTKAGLRRFDLDTVKNWIGDGPDALIHRAIAANGLDVGHSEALHCRLRRSFDVSTLAAPLNYGHVYPGMHDAVVRLAKVLPLIVVTNKPTPLARAVLDTAQLRVHVRAVYGADVPALRKPAPAMLLAGCERLGISVDRLLMVGDSRADLESAAAAGCRAAWVAWGYGQPVEAKAGAPTIWRIEHPDDLVARVLDLRRTDVPIRGGSPAC